MRKDHENTRPKNNKATKECCVVRMFIPTLFICNLYREVNHCCDFSLLSVVEPNAFNSGMFYSKQLPYLCVQCLPAALRDQCPLRSHQAMTSRGWLMKQKAPFAQPCQASRPAHCVVLEVFQHSCDITLSLCTWMTTAVLLWCTDCIIPPRLIDLISDRANCSVFVMPVISPVSWKSRMSCSGNVLLGFDDVLQFSDHSMHCVTDHVSCCFFRVLKFV